MLQPGALWVGWYRPDRSPVIDNTLPCNLDRRRILTSHCRTSDGDCSVLWGSLASLVVVLLLETCDGLCFTMHLPCHLPVWLLSALLTILFFLRSLSCTVGTRPSSLFVSNFHLDIPPSAFHRMPLNTTRRLHPCLFVTGQLCELGQASDFASRCQSSFITFHQVDRLS